MLMPKASDTTKARFAALFADVAGVDVKPMFGNAGAFVNGNMFAGLFGDTVGVKLIDPTSRGELAAIDGTGPFGPVERPMGGYLALPTAWDTKPEVTREWVLRAMAEVSVLPPKRPKAKVRRDSTR